MRRKVMMLSCIAAVAIASFVGKKAFEPHAYEANDLLLQNVEALGSDFGEDWNRKDYDCVAVTCQCIFLKYQSKSAAFVGEGKGSVAHIWECTGCGDCGYTVNK